MSKQNPSLCSKVKAIIRKARLRTITGKSKSLEDAILYLSANPDALNAGLRKTDSKIKKDN